MYALEAEWRNCHRCDNFARYCGPTEECDSNKIVRITKVVVSEEQHVVKVRGVVTTRSLWRECPGGGRMPQAFRLQSVRN
jgi:hypothetical protein